MPFKPIKSKYEIDEVDEEVLWEELRKVPEDLSLKELNIFFKEYLQKNPKKAE